MQNGAPSSKTKSAGTDNFESSGSDGDIEDETQLEDLSAPKRSNGEELDVGDVFELLKNQRRRRVIKFLKEQDDGVTRLDVLAEHIAALENDIDVSQLSSSQRKRVYIGLYQCHLPKMDDFGVIEYQKNRGIIELQDTTQLDRYLSDESEDRRDGRTELTVALSVATIVGIGLTGVGPLGVVPPIGWTLFSVLALVALAVDRRDIRSD